MSSNESNSKPEKITPTSRILKFGASLLGLVLGVELLSGLFHHD